jgi:hypothetical protein
MKRKVTNDICVAKFAILGVLFENDVKNLSDVKTFFQIFNCKLTYNDCTHNYSYTNPLFTAHNLRFGKGSTPKMFALCIHYQNNGNYKYVDYQFTHIFNLNAWLPLFHSMLTLSEQWY